MLGMFKRGAILKGFAVFVAVCVFAGSMVYWGTNVRANSAAIWVNQPVNSVFAKGMLVPQLNPVQLPLLKAIEVNPQNPLDIQFIVDTMDSSKVSQQDVQRMVTYFFGFLTIPQEKLWVNLSPYEHNRIIPQELAAVNIGKDFLLEDYMLKQVTALVTNPDTAQGKQFWHQIETMMMRVAKTTKAPLDLYQKIWVVPEIAQINEYPLSANNQNSTSKIMAVVSKAKLKVMLESDYRAMQQQNKQTTSDERRAAGLTNFNRPTSQLASRLTKESEEIFRQQVLPIIEKHVNQAQCFAPLRQMYYALILAKYFKEKFNQNGCFSHYFDQNKIDPLKMSAMDQTAKEIVFNAYKQTFVQKAYQASNRTEGKSVGRRLMSGGLLPAISHVDVNAAPEASIGSHKVGEWREYVPEQHWRSKKGNNVVVRSHGTGSVNRNESGSIFAELEQKSEAAEQQVQQLTGEVQSLQNEVKTLQEKEKELYKKQSSTQQLHSESTQVIEKIGKNLEKVNGEAQKEKEGQDELTQQVTTLEAQVAELRKEQEQLEREQEKLKKEDAELERDLKDPKISDQKRKWLKEDMGEINSKLEEIEAEGWGRLAKVKKELEKAEDKLTRARSRLKSKEQKVGNHTMALNIQGRKHRTMILDLEKMQEESLQVQGQLQQIQKELEQKQKSLAERQEQLDAAQQWQQLQKIVGPVAQSLSSERAFDNRQLGTVLEKLSTVTFNDQGVAAFADELRKKLEQEFETLQASLSNEAPGKSSQAESAENGNRGTAGSDANVKAKQQEKEELEELIKILLEESATTDPLKEKVLRIKQEQLAKINQELAQLSGDQDQAQPEQPVVGELERDPWQKEIEALEKDIAQLEEKVEKAERSIVEKEKFIRNGGYRGSTSYTEKQIKALKNTIKDYKKQIVEKKEKLKGLKDKQQEQRKDSFATTVVFDAKGKVKDVVLSGEEGIQGKAVGEVLRTHLKDQGISVDKAAQQGKDGSTVSLMPRDAAEIASHPTSLAAVNATAQALQEILPKLSDDVREFLTSVRLIVADLGTVELGQITTKLKGADATSFGWLHFGYGGQQGEPTVYMTRAFFDTVAVQNVAQLEQGLRIEMDRYSDRGLTGAKVDTRDTHKVAEQALGADGIRQAEQNYGGVSYAQAAVIVNSSIPARNSVSANSLPEAFQGFDFAEFTGIAVKVEGGYELTDEMLAQAVMP